MKDGSSSNNRPERASDPLPTAASELNNLLQIITGTVKLLEKMWEGDLRAANCFEMLHLSTDRATQVLSQLVEYAGGSERKILLHPSFANPPLQKPGLGGQGSRCIMVVDDEPMALVLSKHLLTQSGFEVVTAQSGIECLDLYRSQPGRFNLVLLDLTMPLMDGEDTFNRLREIDAKAVVVLNTGFIEENRLEQMMSAGLAGFVRRPYHPAEMIAQINSILDPTGDADPKRSESSPLSPF